MSKQVINTPNAPAAIGTYSQAIRVGQTVYLSGQIGLNPKTMLLEEGIDNQIKQVLQNLKSVAEAAGGDINDLVRLTVYLTDLTHFAKVNDYMSQYFSQPYPARAAVGIATLPRQALVEIDGIMVIS
ncbi:MAG: RidA family protein [Ferrovum sp. 37-45-19]|jgi:reactive intermediate/imine deaminase|uniref:RidA family protein n=1 Tax=Ferrovum sp. JA12 TaxID=1356299 RepID=UPI0007025C55|nr:RidA family protein [Ferrovum sp. JA12]OYV79591.1 MAG: RidA family protein [Ferrovum sp. 21-44-67]OYV94614.1 MAG: RidA family protein [Ferrovum sp. 37-45-19]OZB34560.1 MAG: RidA family protein [Ferrovum sp. 34-44-207]HQT81513.1 RidA family protein [Ferrovaceae bacterium]KRH79485.1 2-iminobutanoate/2-iminopropanoate deaminase [Ferrovum sp. JA12]